MRPAPVPAVKAVAVKPFGETGAAKGSGLGARLSEAVAAALGASGKVVVREWLAVEKATQEKAKSGAAASPVQALVAGDVLGGDAGALFKAQVRLVHATTGETLASDSAALGQGPGAAPAQKAPVAAVAALAPRPHSAVESTSVDVAMRKIADALVAGLQAKVGNARYQRLAVLPFTETGAEAKKRELGAVVTAELSTSLRRDHGLLLVERQRLAQVMGEIKLGQSGAVDPASAPEIGKLADAQALVLGQVAEAGDRYLIDARVVSTETAETLVAASESVPAANLVALSSDAIVLRSKKDAVFRSLLIPGWGQLYNREPVKGYLFLGGVGASLATGLVFHLWGTAVQSDYRTLTTQEQLCASAGVPGAQCTAEVASRQAASLRATSESRFATRNVALLVAGSIWVFNVIDAYVSGVDGDRMLNGPLSVAPLLDDGGRAGFALAWAGRF